MENQEFTKADFADFKRFWESPVGQKYITKMQETRKQLLQIAMSENDRDHVCRSVAIANGFDSILNDIEATIKTAEKNGKEETAKTKKK